MTITLNLEPAQIEALMQRPTAKTDEVEAALYQLIAKQAPKSDAREPVALNEKQQAAVALLRAWNEEEATPEERAQNDAEYEEFKANINEWRVEEERAPAFL